jgi:hypothetical protein
MRPRRRASTSRFRADIHQRDWKTTCSIAGVERIRRAFDTGSLLGELLDLLHP